MQAQSHSRPSSPAQVHHVPSSPSQEKGAEGAGAEKRVTRSQAKKEDKEVKEVKEEKEEEEEVQILAPMIEVSGPDGPMMVFRPWTFKDMKENMEHLPHPADSGKKIARAFELFCREFNPRDQETVGDENGDHALVKDLGSAGQARGTASGSRLGQCK